MNNPGINEFHDPVGCSDFKLAEAWRELMSRVGGQTLPGDMYGRSARDYYARCSVDPRTSTAGLGALLLVIQIIIDIFRKNNPVR